MSALIYTSPRSSPSPAGEPFQHPHHHHQHQHSNMARHQVAFGQSHHQNSASTSSSSSSSIFGNSGPSAQSTTSSAFAHGHAPSSGASSFGFGFASSTSSGSTSTTNYAASASSSTSSPFKLPSNAVMTSYPSSIAGPSTSPNRRRRRRSDSPDEREMEDVQNNDADMSTAAGKRIRREIRPVKSMAALTAVQSQSQSQASSAQNSSIHGSSSNANSRDELDVGKALASLSKPALLSVLTSLLATQPSLKPVVLALLPAPSLESFTSTLQAAEKKVLDALPVGRSLRDEYIWSRIRAPLEEYISEARLALSQFCPSATSLASSEQDSSSQHHQQQQQQQQQQHPATIFSFLFTLTQSVRKLEIILPRAPLPFGSSRFTSSSTPSASINNPSSLNQNDPLVCFLPALINQWHVLVTKLSNLVNQNGRVLSAEMVRTWFKQLDALVDVDISGNTHSTISNIDNDATSVGRKACESVRERFIKELGWLVGIRTPAASTAPQGHGGIQAVANQFMDSRMMMADNDESDEEL